MTGNLKSQKAWCVVLQFTVVHSLKPEYTRPLLSANMFVAVKWVLENIPTHSPEDNSLWTLANKQQLGLRSGHGCSHLLTPAEQFNV